MDERTKQAGLNAFVRIVEAWGLKEAHGALLLGVDEMPRVDEVTHDQLERISHTLSIYRSLHTLLADPHADAWIRKPNHAPLFGGMCALDLLKTGTQGFLEVRIYLAAQVGGDPSW